MNAMESLQTHRSGTFMIAFQLEGIVAAIRHAMSCGVTPGDATIQLLNRIRKDFQQASDGTAIERLPEITGAFNPADVLVTAELLHRTILAFLTPEEAEARRDFGFHTIHDED